ncbi:MAG: L-histidine N-alpha-methyltransferase [Gammaproteobacteria bacterium]|jgi:L-histidine N-alpha-methyltransferase
MSTILAPSIVTLSTHNSQEELARDIVKGMDSSPKAIPSKYFYDEHGGQLFGAITQLPEYYLTRAETALIRRHASTIVARTKALEVLEVGSGSAEKICLFLDKAHGHEIGHYASIDINAAALDEAAQDLKAQHPNVSVTGYIGDFISDLSRMPAAAERRLVAFFGSTIGNLDEPARADFFQDVATVLGEQDSFLLGIDLVKDRDVLHNAYNDSQGITAEFTLNILRVINRELSADFPLDGFVHVPRWNESLHRMEAWLRATRAMTVKIADVDMTINLAAQEEMLTEVSYKFTRESIEPELGRAKLALTGWYTDEAESFALALITKARPTS